MKKIQVNVMINLKRGDYSGAITNTRTLVEEILLTIEEEISDTKSKRSNNFNKS